MDGFNLDVNADTSGMIGAFLQRWALPTFAAVRLKFEHFSFFGVSSTGCPVDPATGCYVDVNSNRVADPLTWLLASFGVISYR